ncbi:glycoside hydrolase family 3 N-terminal domain-containing protein [Cytophagales bacterium LB-30]|uniref:beta-N-acetylhexosaminidase n=1 Tax=Shiella aurantiaca TaxID=3058365 RepID=A0ABT8F362_9BACT|nr:glycoside hydrolase family 3 N-terminal domain-containing protein [Shiella aurantiaca]MDN4164714.1 glycoside hydrolase family 3 N-terminal domain-containing protein [Shiella aurantiaca]
MALLSFLGYFVQAQQSPLYQDTRQQQWVDSVFNALSQEQRLGQLFMVAAYSNKDERHYTEIEALIRRFNLGGLIFFQGGPGRQAHLTNRYQQAAPTPLLIAMDAEWGLGMRLDSVISYPRQIALGAIKNDQLIYDMGAEIARQSKRLGVHINFAPVVDINSNPNNPVIGFRSFGENKFRVAQKGIAYMKGMQDHGLMADAKHFPGHGDTGTDSHYSLPVIRHSSLRMDSVELFPFRSLIDQGLMSAMVAHIHVPAYDTIPNKATTLSKNVVTDLLKTSMKFDGLIFTDALNMRGVSDYYPPGEVDMEALLAGNDVLLYSEDVPLTIELIKEAFVSGRLQEDDINRRIKKILAAKYKLGLNKPQEVALQNLHEDLNAPKGLVVKQKLFESAVTVVKNEEQALPFKHLEIKNFASLSLGEKEGNEFQLMLDNYAPFTHYALKNEQKTIEAYSELINKLKWYDVVVVGVHGLNNTVKKNFGVNPNDAFFLDMLAKYTQVVTVVFGNPYSLKFFEQQKTLVCAYQDEAMMREVAPQALFGAFEVNGSLPVSVSASLKEGTGNTLPSLGRLGYGLPESVQVSSDILAKIDAIAREAIESKATPGCQVLVAKGGKVILNKGYGYQTYDSLIPVNSQTIYDVASVTKVAATLQTVMFLEDRDIISLDKKASNYLPELRATNKKNLSINAILAHQAGLQPYIPFWKRTLDETGQPQADFYSAYPESSFLSQVAGGLYGHTSLKDSVWKWTLESDLLPLKKRWSSYEYKYSDMGFYIMQKMSERLLNQPMEIFLEDNLYRPLGLSTMTYLPLCKFPVDRIAPTERDTYFRNEQICGIVHDQGAAMYGGIAGHAGIFSNANDLAILMQMHLQNGYYGGHRYFQEKTIPKFTEKHFRGNRRGLGWDKPATGKENNPASQYASYKTYGHTGFTGTAVWVDPEHDLIYVFLSNRIYPDANNTLLIKNNIRTRVQDVIYEAMWSDKNVTDLAN